MKHYGKESAEIVCLCGSMRFKDAFLKLTYSLEKIGNIVVGPCFAPDENIDRSDEQIKIFDAAHRSKIDLCDYVVVVNVGGYIGKSTASEIQYALERGRRVVYLEPLSSEQVSFFFYPETYNGAN